MRVGKRESKIERRGEADDFENLGGRGSRGQRV